MGRLGGVGRLNGGRKLVGVGRLGGPSDTIQIPFKYHWPLYP